MPQIIKISKIDIDNIIIGNPFDIKYNSKILIVGESGSGKTTFVKALLGKIKGIELDYGKPENFTHQIIEFFQNIKEKLPTRKITTRQLFDNGTNSQITEALKITNSYEWIMKLTKQEKTRKISKSFVYNLFGWQTSYGNVIENCDNIHPFDIEINERHSGGEKTKLALATRIYRLLKDPNIKMLILDEPEQGLDPEIAYKIIQNIFDRFSDKIVIIISHLEKIREKYQWDMEFKIEGGIMNQI